jgi:hypothetical protein
MSEVVHVFDARINLDGVPYVAQVAARPNGHIWEGWIEFVALDGSDARRTPRETTQPDRAAMEYWATGISATYLEGALARTIPRPAATAEVQREAVFDGPAPIPGANTPLAADRAVLDPFSVGAKGETLLRQQLGALEAWHLRNIVRAYELADEAVVDLEQLDHPALVELIVAAVELA